METLITSCWRQFFPDPRGAGLHLASQFSYVCSHICSHIHSHICSHICSHIRLHIRLHIRSHIRLHIRSHIRSHICSHIRSHIRLHIRLLRSNCGPNTFIRDKETKGQRDKGTKGQRDKGTTNLKNISLKCCIASEGHLRSCFLSCSRSVLINFYEHHYYDP